MSDRCFPLIKTPLSNDKHSHPVRSYSGGQGVCQRKSECVCVWKLHQQQQTWPCQTIKVTLCASHQNGRKRQPFVPMLSVLLFCIPLSEGLPDLCMQEWVVRKSKLVCEHCVVCNESHIHSLSLSLSLSSSSPHSPLSSPLSLSLSPLLSLLTRTHAPHARTQRTHAHHTHQHRDTNT